MFWGTWQHFDPPCLQGASDAGSDAAEKGDNKDKPSPFEEDKGRELSQAEGEDKANGRGLANGMEADCKDFK